MNIGQNYLHSHDSDRDKRVRQTEGNLKNTNVSKADNNAANISNLKEGTVFRGEILNITNKDVMIALENHQVINAKMADAMELSIGQELYFAIKEQLEGQVVIKPFMDQNYNPQNQIIEQALEANHFLPTEKNFSVVKALMDAGLPIDKGTITALLGESLKYEGTSMDTLVTLHKMNIPVNEGNLLQYARYSQLTHQLGTDIGQTAEAISKFKDFFPSDVGKDTLLEFSETLIQIFHENEAQVQSANQTISDETILINQETAGEAVLNNQEINEDNLVNENNLVPKQAEQGIENKQTLIAAKIKTEDSDLLSKEETVQLMKQLQSVGMQEEEITQAFGEAKNPVQVLQQIQKLLESPQVSLQAAKQVLESKEFQFLIQDMIQKNWSINPNHMKDAKEIDSLYEKMGRQLKQVSAALEQGGGDSKNFGGQSKSMQENMRFIQDLNQNFAYAQIPVKFHDKDINSELYVYADKRKLMQKKDGISVMLHLDMEHLGKTDVKVSLTGNKVNARFYLNDQVAVDIVANHMEQLEEAIRGRGFELINEVIKRQPAQSINQVVDEIIDKDAERSVKRFTFDMRG